MGNAESTEAFNNELNKLKEISVEKNNEAFKTIIGSLPEEEGDVYMNIKTDDLKFLKDNKPKNLAFLVWNCIDLLHEAVTNKSYPSEAETRICLNCVRLLTRLIPFLFETNSQDDFVAMTLWKNSLPERYPTAEVEVKEIGDGVPYAGKLIHALLGLLFIPNFTIGADIVTGTAVQAYGVDPNVIWIGGVGAKEVKTYSNSTMEFNRYLIMKCLVTCCSETLYLAPDDALNFINPWMWVLTSQFTKNASNLFYSLLNSICAYEPNGPPLPYLGYLKSDQSYYIDACIQTLCILTDFRLMDQETLDQTIEQSEVHKQALKCIEKFKEEHNQFNEDQERMGKTGDDVQTINFDEGVPQTNVFASLMNGIKNRDDCLFVFDGLQRLLNNLIDANNTYLPGSVLQVECQQELMFLFWKLAHHNREFTYFMLNHAKPLQIARPLLFLLDDACSQQTKTGLLQFTSFIILHLSSERDFCISLNAAYEGDLPLNLNIPEGSHADVLIALIHKLLTQTQERLSSIYNILLTILTNIAPYIIKLNLDAAMKLVDMFRMFATKKSLLKRPENHLYLISILDAVNYLIHYQYQGSHALVYMVMRQRRAFELLNDMKLENKKEEEKNQAPLEGEEQKVTDGDETKPAEGEEAKKEEPKEWQPTEEWLQSIKSKIPLQSCLKIVNNLYPKVEIFSSENGVDEEEPILDYLKTQTMVGLLPMPKQIIVKKFQDNKHTHAWFTSHIWGVIFVRTHRNIPFDKSAIKLFTLNTVQESQAASPRNGTVLRPYFVVY